MKPIIAENLSYSYGKQFKPALSDITFSINQGEALGIIGLNGSGKSTLCYCLCGIIPHFFSGSMSGRVLINGLDSAKAPLQQLTSHVGIVMQDPNIQLLMPTVEDDIAFGLENQNIDPKQIDETVSKVIRLVGVSALRNENPNNLSGGEKQLVALATVLAMNPAIIIFDESLSMLDEEAVKNIISVMQKLKEKGTTMVIIDHTGKGQILYDRVAVLENGRIIFLGKKAELINNRDFLIRHHLDPDFSAQPGL